MIKILFISHEATHTGAPLSMLSMLRYIVEYHKDITFDILLLNGGSLINDFASVGCIYKLKRKRTLGKYIRRKLLGQDITYDYDFSFLYNTKYNLIYANSIASINYLQIIESTIHAPILMHIHESEYLMEAHNISSAALDLCHHFIANSHLVERTLIKKYGIERSRITVIFPFSDFESLALCHQKHHILRKDDFVIGLVGYTSWIKGTDILPILIKRMEEKYPELPFRFIHIGKLYEDSRLQLKYDISHINGFSRVSFIGSTENPVDLYAQFDVFLLLSREDSFSLACAENALMGNPIICMEGASGIAEELKKENAAIVVPYLSIENICDAIHKLWVDSSLYSELSYKASEKARTSFMKDYSMNKIISLLRNY